MEQVWANEFGEIQPTFQLRLDLQEQVVGLLSQDMPGKVTEGGNRLELFRGILLDIVRGKLSLAEAYSETLHQLPRRTSRHAGSNRVFTDGWEERLVRTQLSRLYSQAVLEHILIGGGTRCYVPHSSAEDPTTPCSRFLAGEHHDAVALHQRLMDNYTRGRWSPDLKIPNHPHCTHVVKPARQ